MLEPCPHNVTAFADRAFKEAFNVALKVGSHPRGLYKKRHQGSSHPEESMFTHEDTGRKKAAVCKPRRETLEV